MSDGRDEAVSNPPDLFAVRADDALLDALGGSDPKVADELGQAELNELLLSWSREVDSEPMPQLVDTDTAIATIRAAKEDLPKRERRRRLYVPVAAAAAVLAVAFGGASIAARDAQPGDTLWGLTKVLYADKASSVEASYDVRAEFKIAENALDDGELDAARDALDKARNALDDVNDEEGHDGLQSQHDELRDQLEGDGSDNENEDSPSSGNQSPDSSSPSESEPTDPSSETSTPPDTSTSEPPPTTDPPASSTDGETTSDDGSRTSDGEGAGANGVNGADSGTDGGMPAGELATTP